TTCGGEKSTTVGRELGAEYVQYLESDLAKGTPVALGGISFALRTFEFPVVYQTPEELRHDADLLRARGKTERQKDYWAVNAKRLDEMALLEEKGFDMGVNHELQVIRIGEAELMFIPGEFYVQPGCELLEKAASEFTFAVTVSNGNGQYFFTEKSGLRYPGIDAQAEKLFGFYEIYGYMHQLRSRYQNNICAFIIEKLLEVEKLTNA
ncbi:MAG: hypothetical protein IKA87_08260, partial [Lentisphaeria bacterium]|nr:hypothetical protein [Lentisphaeria bacterium]